MSFGEFFIRSSSIFLSLPFPLSCDVFPCLYVVAFAVEVSVLGKDKAVIRVCWYPELGQKVRKLFPKAYAMGVSVEDDESGCMLP